MPEGGACFTEDNKGNQMCGACVKDCGNTTDAICNAYGFTDGKCGISATGGGGRCGKGATDKSKTLVCCVINKIDNKQDSVKPTNGVCSPFTPFSRR